MLDLFPKTHFLYWILISYIDCLVIIDASNFVYYLHSISPGLSSFGGDYPLFVSNLLRVLNAFQRCRVRPCLFLMGAIHSPVQS